MKKLIAAAKELNEVMGLTPPIKVAKVSEEELTALLKKAGAQIVPDEDVFSAETTATLKRIEAWPIPEGADDAADTAGADAGEDDPEPANEKLVDALVEINAIVKAPEKLKALKALVKSDEAFESMRKRIAGRFDTNEILSEMFTLAGAPMESPEEDVDATKIEVAKSDKKEPKAPKEPKEPKAEKSNRGSATPGKGSGIIATIVELLTNATAKTPMTKAKILATLVAKFPDRDEASMKSTINVQVPARISKEKFALAGDSTTGFYKK